MGGAHFLKACVKIDFANLNNNCNFVWEGLRFLEKIVFVWEGCKFW